MARSWGRGGEVERVVFEDDAVLVVGVRGRARHAQAHIPKRRSHQGISSVLQRRLLRHEDFPFDIAIYTKMHSWRCATRDEVCANASF